MEKKLQLSLNIGVFVIKLFFSKSYKSGRGGRKCHIIFWQVTRHHRRELRRTKLGMKPVISMHERFFVAHRAVYWEHYYYWCEMPDAFMCSCSAPAGRFRRLQAPRRVRLEHFSQFLENSLSSFTAGVHSAKIQLREPALYGQKNPWEKRSKTSHQPKLHLLHLAIEFPIFHLSWNLNVFSKAWKVKTFDALNSSKKRGFQLLKWNVSGEKSVYFGCFC